MSLSDETIRNNVAEIERRIEAGAIASGRNAAAVQLIAVSKYVDAEQVRILHSAGCKNFGESRPQVLWEKAEQLSDLDIRWHFIGNLQRNKARRTVAISSLIHSGSSLKLLETINAICQEDESVCNVLIEVNVSGDKSKHGFQAEEIEPSLAKIATLKHVKVNGLMAMAARMGGKDQARNDFESLRLLRDSLQANCPPQIDLTELSMGMSGDFEIAIKEGATMVRIGSALTAG